MASGAGRWPELDAVDAADAEGPVLEVASGGLLSTGVLLPPGEPDGSGIGVYGHLGRVRAGGGGCEAEFEQSW